MKLLFLLLPFQLNAQFVLEFFTNQDTHLIKANVEFANYAYEGIATFYYIISDKTNVNIDLAFNNDDYRDSFVGNEMRDGNFGKKTIKVLTGDALEIMGFCPYYEEFERTSPRYDIVFVSTSGLRKVSVLAHELAHFFGVMEHSHNDDNILSYSSTRYSFDYKQLEILRKQIELRKYLQHD